MKVQGAQKLLRLCTEASDKSDKHIKSLNSPESPVFATLSSCQVDVLEQITEHSSLLGVGALSSA